MKKTEDHVKKLVRIYICTQDYKFLKKSQIYFFALDLDDNIYQLNSLEMYLEENSLNHSLRLFFPLKRNEDGSFDLKGCDTLKSDNMLKIKEFFSLLEKGILIAVKDSTITCSFFE
jgi:hypothetical protein